MCPKRIAANVVAGLAILGLAVPPARATTLVRAGLERLTADNEMVLHSRVIDTRSYWNADHTFILTDVRLEPVRTFKGAAPGKEVIVTLLGGTVGELTTVIVGGPELAPGLEYVLFLSHQNLPGAAARLSVRDLVQGVFSVTGTGGDRRAVSQAMQHPLLPDAAGVSEPPGGPRGFALTDLSRRVHELDGR